LCQGNTVTAPTSRVQHVFRLSAVRRPLLGGDACADPPAAGRVSDEELVDALWTMRARLESRLREEAARQLPALGITAVYLENVQPVGSVRVQLGFVTAGEERPGASVADLSPALVVTVRELLSDVLGGPVAVSASPEPPDPEVVGPESLRTAWDRLAPVLAAVGTGVGLIGFVTFVGGIIVWARARAAGIPAAPTLGIFPSQDLLVIGAETLVPTVFQALFVVVALAVIYALVRVVVRGHIPHLGDKWVQREAAVLAGEAPLSGGVGMFFFVLLSLAVFLVLFGRGLTSEQFVDAVVGAAIAALIAATVGSVTRRFVYLATTTYILAGLFLGALAYWEAGNEEAVRGAAIIRENQRPVAGVFVAEAAGRVYLARIVVDHDGRIVPSRSRLVGIAKSEVTDIAIADRTTPSIALANARRLAWELCGLQPASARPARQQAGICRRALIKVKAGG
jgi:hypothetical protein